VTLSVHVLEQRDHPRREGPFISIGGHHLSLAIEHNHELASRHGMRLGLRYDLNLWIGDPFGGATYLPR
jgi:hypothetical protein